jgi:hypothetical protein
MKVVSPCISVEDRLYSPLLELQIGRKLIFETDYFPLKPSACCNVQFFQHNTFISHSISTNIRAAGALMNPIAQVWTEAAAAASPTVACVSSVDACASVDSCPWLIPERKHVTYCERVKRKTESDVSKTINEYIRETSAFIESLYSDGEKDIDTPCFRDFIQGQFCVIQLKRVLMEIQTSTEEKQHEYVLIYFEIM